MINENEINELSCEILSEDIAYDLTFKIILIGDSGVGKSSLILRTKNYFENKYKATIGFEFSTFVCKINNKIIKLQIWDTCGQEVYRSLVISFYRNSSLAIIVYSIDNIDSFQHINNWLNDLRDKNNPNIKKFLIGNKNDLENERKVSFEEGENFYKEMNFDYFTECSAKTGINVNEIFIRASKLLYIQQTKYLNHNSFRYTLYSFSDSNDDIENNKISIIKSQIISKNDEKEIKKKKFCCN